MKIYRLLGETIYLLNHGRTSAQVLAECFQVSTRTIMRDMDTLCLAGIPILSNCGIAGGYEIMDTFKMQQQIAGEIDYHYIICALEGLATAYVNKDINATLEKMKSLSYNTNNPIIMDLGVVHENRDTNQMLFLLNKYIKSNHYVSFLYTNSKDEQKEVEVEPVATIYKWYNWYLIGYSPKSSKYYMYKVIRMEKLKQLEKEKIKEHNLDEVKRILENSAHDRKIMTIKLYCNGKIKSKCREYLNGNITKEYDNGDFEYELTVPENEQFWYGVILSFGKNAKVLSPPELINQIKDNCMDMIKMYEDVHTSE